MENEIKEEKLDSPLVVHKKSDASYQEDSAVLGMQTTHTDEESDAPTLERHRFKKEKKKKKSPYIFAAILVIAVCVVAVLFSNGTIKLPAKETTTAAKKSYTTQAENPFTDTITVKGTYIFYEGVEVDGIEGLDREIKYQDEGKTFTVQDEHADSTFLNSEVLSLLSQYGMNYNVTYIESSGLNSKYETTAAPSETEFAASDTTAAPAASSDTSADVQQ